MAEADVVIEITGHRRGLNIGAGSQYTHEASRDDWGQQDLETLPWWPQDSSGQITWGWANLYARGTPMRITRLTYPEWQPNEAQWNTLRDEMKPGEVHTFSRVTPGGSSAAVRGVVLSVAMAGTNSGVPLRVATILELPSESVPDALLLTAQALTPVRVAFTAYVRNPTSVSRDVYFRWREEGTDTWSDATVATAQETVVHEPSPSLTAGTTYEVQADTDPDFGAPATATVTPEVVNPVPSLHSVVYGQGFTRYYIEFSPDLDTGHTPTAAAFGVSWGAGIGQAISFVGFQTVGGTSVFEVRVGSNTARQEATITYTKPATVASRLQDEFGNEVDDFTITGS